MTINARPDEPTDLDSSIDLAALRLRQIVDESRRQHATNITGTATALPGAAAFFDMQRHAYVNTHWDIAWPNWPPGVLAKFVALYQKVTRRMLSWYIEPIVKQQNQFNIDVLRAVQATLAEVQTLRAELAGLDSEQRARLAALAERLSTLEQTLKRS